MRNQKGKANISSILIIAILVYGGFAAFKIISSRVTKSQIKNDIIEKFGYIRGPDFTPEKGEQIIREILIEHNLYSEDVSVEEENEYENESGGEDANAEYYGTRIAVEIRQKGAKIWFAVEYIDEINLLLFKTKSRYYFEYEMYNYN
jgi:serine/threonine protein kinase